MTHELGLMADLLAKTVALAAELNARKVVAVDVQVGALLPLSGEALREHFSRAAQGTLAEGATLHIKCNPLLDQHAHHLLLEGIEVEASEQENP